MRAVHVMREPTGSNLPAGAGRASAIKWLDLTRSKRPDPRGLETAGRDLPPGRRSIGMRISASEAGPAKLFPQYRRLFSRPAPRIRLEQPLEFVTGFFG